MPDQWDMDCPQTPDLAQAAEQVRLVCVCCGDLYGALQTPADAVYTWLDQVKCKVFKKLDKAGDRAVIAILETAYAIRDKLGTSGPPYPGAVPAAESPQSADAAPNAPNVSAGTSVSSGDEDVYIAAPGSVLDADFDKPHVYQFGERSAPWHARVAAYYHGALDPLLDSATWQSYQKTRDDEVAALLAADPPSWSQTFDGRFKE